MDCAMFTVEWYEQDKGVVDFNLISGWFSDSWGYQGGSVFDRVGRMPKREWLEFRKILESSKQFRFEELVQFPCGHYRRERVIGDCPECHFNAYFKKSPQKLPRGGFF